MWGRKVIVGEGGQEISDREFKKFDQQMSSGACSHKMRQADKPGLPQSLQLCNMK